MDILDYVKKKEKLLEKCSRILRDPHVFEFNYIPEQPLMRGELKPVIDALARYSKTGISNHILLVGSRGCGKTLSVQYLRGIFSKRGLNVLYVNCRFYNTSYKILAYLLGVRARGVSFDELTQRFSEQHAGRTVVILDEIDLLSERDRNKDILYFLSRSDASYMAILLSNSTKWMANLDESIQSTLQPELIYFHPYSANEISKILGSRAKLGMRSYTESVVKQIAALVAKYSNSDVRIALKTLYYWATEPNISLEENFKRARRDVVVDVVKSLSDKNLLILKAGAGPEKTVKEVYSLYRGLCVRHKEEPFSYVHFYSSLSYLQSLGLILLISTKIRRTYTKTLQLSFQPEVLESFWRLRFC